MVKGVLKKPCFFPAASCLIRGPTPRRRPHVVSLFLEYLKTCLIVLIHLFFSSGSFLASSSSLYVFPDRNFFLLVLVLVDLRV